MENNQELIRQCEEKARQWLSPSFDEATRKEVQAMLDNEDKTDLIDAFYQNLEFGTGGLRGIMGAGTNRMNKYIVGMATQGFANYILKAFPGRNDLAVVVGHDCRNNGRMFAETVADIFSANGIKVYLFESLRPTPEISFAIRQLGAQAGVNVTASHNPKEYNGYKAYWDDGAQVVSPHDVNIIDYVNRIADPSIQLISCTIGCAGFALMFGARRRALPFSVIGSFLTWTVFLVAVNRFSCTSFTATLLSSCFVALYAGAVNAVTKIPSAIFLTSCCKTPAPSGVGRSRRRNPCGPAYRCCPSISGGRYAPLHHGMPLPP